MPITVGAIRKLRADKRKKEINTKIKQSFRKAISDMRKKPTAKNLQKAFSELDRATKSSVLHDNTAGRLKSRLSRLLKK